MKTKYTLNWPDTYRDSNERRCVSPDFRRSTFPKWSRRQHKPLFMFFLIIIFCLVAFVRINRVKPVLCTHVSCSMRPSAHHSKHSACARHVYKFICVHAELVNFTCTLPRPHAFIRYKFLNFVYEPQTSQQYYQYNTFNGLAPGWFVGNENKLKLSTKYMPMNYSVFGKTIFFKSLFIHFQTL